MRYIIVKTQVHKGTPNTLSLLVLTRSGCWVPWSEVEGKTNCTDPNLSPVLSFPDYDGAYQQLVRWHSNGTIVPVDTDNPIYIK